MKIKHTSEKTNKSKKKLKQKKVTWRQNIMETKYIKT